MNSWRDTIPEIPDDLEIRENVAPAKAPQTESRDPSVAAQPDPTSVAEGDRGGNSTIVEVNKSVELIADDVPPLLIAILEELKIISSKLEEFGS